MDFDLFIQERNEALLSLDREKIEAYLRKYGSPIASNDALFWASVHKARTAIPELPFEDRQKSIDWLNERKLTHWGD
jgi:hypothetical protein